LTGSLSAIHLVKTYLGALSTARPTQWDIHRGQDGDERRWDQAEGLEQVQEKRSEGEEINLPAQTILEPGWVLFPADGQTKHNNKLNQ